MCYVMGQLLKTLKTLSATDILFKAAKKPLDLFPRVPQTDSIFFIVEFHGLSHGKMCFLSINGVHLANVRDF